MLSKENLALIEQRFSVLPEQLQAPLSDPNLRPVLRSVATVHGLSPREAQTLENEVVFVLLLLEPYYDLAPNLTRELGLSPARAAALAGNALSAVLLPDALLSLEEIYREMGEVPSNNSASAAQPPKIVGYANIPRPAPMRQPAPPTVPTYRKPLTDTPRYDNRPGGDAQSAR